MAHEDEIRRLTRDLLDVTAKLGTARAGVSIGAASVAHESLLVELWSLKLRIATLQSIGAHDPDARIVAEAAMVAASREIAEHERRLVVARKSRDLDAEDDAKGHEQEQAAVGSRFLELKARRTAKAG